MNTPQLLAAAALAASLAACSGTPKPVQTGTPEPAPAAGTAAPLNNLIVFFQDAKDRQTVLDAARDYGAEVLYDYQNLNAVALKIPPHKSMDEAERHFAALAGVVGVNRDQSHRLHPVQPMKR